MNPVPSGATAPIARRHLLRTLCLAALAGGLPAQVHAQDLDCLVEPSQVVDIRAAVDGLITGVYVKRGDVIQRGQTLVKLQSTAEEAAVEAARYRATMGGRIASARSRLQFADVKAARVNELQRASFVSAQASDEVDAERRLAASELMAATEERELAAIELRRAKAQLALRTLTAPFSGVVVDRMQHPGDLAEAGAGRKPVLRVARIDPMKVDIVVPAAAFGMVGTGSRVTVVAQGSGKRVVATVSDVDKVVDAASATFAARVELPNADGAIAGGVRCTAQIEGLVGLQRQTLKPGL